MEMCCECMPMSAKGREREESIILKLVMAVQSSCFLFFLTYAVTDLADSYHCDHPTASNASYKNAPRPTHWPKRPKKKSYLSSCWRSVPLKRFWCRKQTKCILNSTNCFRINIKVQQKKWLNSSRSFISCSTHIDIRRKEYIELITKRKRARYLIQILYRN